MNYTTQAFQAGQVLRASQLNAMDNAIQTSMKAAMPVEVNLGKEHLNLEGTWVTVLAKGLEPNTQYALQLFRYSSSKHAWDMMHDDLSGQSNFGWEFLRGKIRAHDQFDDTYTYFTDEIPDWMSNNGLLQGRWLFTTSAGEKEKLLTFKPSTWIVDALKPGATTWEDSTRCSLIGARAQKHSSFKFKAGIMQKTADGSFQLVGMSTTVLHIYFKGANSLSINSNLTYNKNANDLCIRVIG